MSRHKEPRKRFALLTALVVAFTLLFMALGLGAPASANGNAGTIKIHEGETPSGTESNDPKICVFNIEGFGFDEGFDGYIEFDVQGGDGPTGVFAGPFAVGPANADGYFESMYFNDSDGPTIQNGHYKVTLYGKFNGAINYEDIKAKSKVFKVDCPPPPTPVAPTEPTPVDKCEPATGPTNDRIVIPSDANFTYQVDGKDVTAGEVVATGTSHTVTAVAKQGVVVKQGAKTSWTFTFTKVNCPVTPPPPPVPPVVTPPVVTPPVVTPPETTSTELTKIWGNVRKVDKCGRAGDSFYAKRVKHGKYLVKGKAVREGVWLRAKTLVVKVKFVSTTKKHVAAGKDSWTLRFTNKPCITPPKHLPPTGA